MVFGKLPKPKTDAVLFGNTKQTWTSLGQVIVVQSGNGLIQFVVGIRFHKIYLITSA